MAWLSSSNLKGIMQTIWKLSDYNQPRRFYYCMLWKHVWKKIRVTWQIISCSRIISYSLYPHLLWTPLKRIEQLSIGHQASTSTHFLRQWKADCKLVYRYSTCCLRTTGNLFRKAGHVIMALRTITLNKAWWLCIYSVTVLKLKRSIYITLKLPTNAHLFTPLS